MKKKEQNIRYIRYAVQALGFLATILGLLINYPIANSILLGITLILGPVFCGWICPFGTLQDVFATLGHKLGIKKYKMPTKLKKIFVPLRYILLFITILVSADYIFTLMTLDPRGNFTTFLGGNALTIIGWSVIFIFLAASMVFERPFCNYFCIEGAKLGGFGTLRPLTIIRNEETCVGCSKCNGVCPMNIDVASHGQVRSLQCINCMECVAACPVKNTLKVGVIPGKNITKKVVLALAAMTFLLVVYTGVNSNSIMAMLARDNSIPVSTAITGEAAAGYGDAAGIADGVYEGTGTGFRGQITVEVTVKNQQITQIEVTKNNDDAKWFNRAYSIVTSNIIKNQSAEVEVVSGATYSSLGIKEGVANALINAGGKSVKAIVNDLPKEGKGQHGKRRER